VPNGGVLFALPALLAVGLLRGAERFFELPKGYWVNAAWTANPSSWSTKRSIRG